MFFFTLTRVFYYHRKMIIWYVYCIFIVLIKIAITSIKIVKENLLLIKGGGLLSKLVVVQAGERIKHMDG